MITKRYLLKLFLLSLASVALGAGVVFALNCQTVRDYLAHRNSPVAERSVPKGEERPKDRIATFSGTIKPVSSSAYRQGSHILEDSSGKLITVLESPKIDLNFLEGQTVEVEGILKRIEGGEGTILVVDKVRF